MKNHFIYAYSGNKRTECPTIYEEVKDIFINKNIDTIIEPYCGSSAFSFYMANLHPKKYKYILNDNDKYLIELYKIIKDKKKRKEFERKINEEAQKIINKEAYTAMCKKDCLESYYLKHKIYTIRPGLYRLDYKYKEIKIDDSPIIKFLETENIKFFNDDALNIFNKYKDNEKAFIFLDPPYLALCNDFYENKNVNIYEYLYKNKINEMKASIILVLEKMWIIELLFSAYKIKEYSKRYETTKKNTTHIIILNDLK